MIKNILCLSRSYGSYAVRNNYITKFRSPTTSCAHYCQLSGTQSSHSTIIRRAIALSRHSSSSNSISAASNEHLSGIQKDRERAAAMLTAASGGSQSTKPPIRNIIQNGQSLVKAKINSVYQYIDRFSRTNEIREAHEHVERLQEDLIEIQQKRREIGKEITDTHYDIQMLYGELASCQKGEPRYLDLVRKEYEIHNKEKQMAEEFNLLDKAERDLFIHLQAAVKTSHEKEKIHTNSAKYWSIVGSLLGALLGICGTAFSFYNRNNMITSMLHEVQEEFVQLRSEAEKNRSEIHQLVGVIRKLTQQEESKRHSMSDKKTSAAQSNESWMHWIGRTTYVISAYRYFVPRSSN